MICPKCQHEKSASDSAVMAGVCPRCGIAYNKWKMRTPDESNMVATSEAELADAADKTLDELSRPSRWQQIYRYTCFMPSDRHESAFWGHGLIYVIFTVWGLHFMLDGIDAERISGSFLHLVNLPFHEYGHIMFSPFGTFMMFLGGSLFQIMVPLLPLCAFMVLQRDNFAASIMLWWAGQNFIDVSVYIADAPVRLLPLVNGDIDSHDWWNLLSTTNRLDAAGTYATLCFLLGALIMLLSSAWGGHLLWIEFKGRTAPGFRGVE